MGWTGFDIYKCGDFYLAIQIHLNWKFKLLRHPLGPKTCDCHKSFVDGAGICIHLVFVKGRQYWEQKKITVLESYFKVFTSQVNRNTNSSKIPLLCYCYTASWDKQLHVCKTKKLKYCRARKIVDTYFKKESTTQEVFELVLADWKQFSGFHEVLLFYLISFFFWLDSRLPFCKNHCSLFSS